MRVNEEGHYTIKRVKELPKRGNFNWLYAIIGPKIDRVYRALPNGEWEEIILGESTDLFKDTVLEYVSETNTLNITFADGSQKSVVITTKTSELENDGDGTSNFATLEDLSQTSAGAIAAPSFVVALGGGKTLGKYLNGQTVPAFTTIQDQLKDIAQETINPDISNGPTFSLSLLNISTQEVGTTYSSTLTGNFNRGQILGNLDGGIWNATLEQNKRAGVASSFTLDGITQAGSSLVVSRVIILGPNTFNGTVFYSEGSQPLNSVGGNFSTPLPANNLNASRTFQGQYRYWVYSGTLGSSPTTSAPIRAITNFDFIINKTFNVVIPQGDTEFSIYLKQTINLVGVLYQESSNANITANFVETSVTVNDAQGTPVAYKKLTQSIGGTGYTANATYIITITA